MSTCISLGTPEQEKALRAMLAGLKDTQGATMPALQKAQEIYGYLPMQVQECVADALDVPLEEVYGVATFYNQFRFQPQGKFHIQVCRGTACHVKGSAAVLDAIRRELKTEPGQTTRDGLFSLEVVACIGACGLAPVIAINGEFHAGLTTKKVETILNSYRKRAKEDDKGAAA